MSEMIILTRLGAALRVDVVRRPGPRLRTMVVRLLGEGWTPLRIARRLRVRRTYVDRLRRGEAPAALLSSRAAWSSLVARETRALERILGDAA